MSKGIELQHNQSIFFISQDLVELSSGTDKMFVLAKYMIYLWSTFGFSIYVESKKANFSITIIWYFPHIMCHYKDESMLSYLFSCSTNLPSCNLIKRRTVQIFWLPIFSSEWLFISNSSDVMNSFELFRALRLTLI